MRKATILTAATIAALTIGCSSGNDNAPTGATTSPPEQPSAGAPTDATTSPPGQPTAGERCVEVPDRILTQLAEGSSDGTVELGPIAPVAGAAVQSNQRSQLPPNRVVWLIAMTFEVEGEQRTGLWASIRTDDTPDLTDDEGLPGGLTISVDDTAHQVTVWPYGPDTNTGVDPDFDGAQEALDCLA